LGTGGVDLLASASSIHYVVDVSGWYTLAAP